MFAFDVAAPDSGSEHSLDVLSGGSASEGDSEEVAVEMAFRELGAAELGGCCIDSYTIPGVS